MSTLRERLKRFLFDIRTRYRATSLLLRPGVKKGDTVVDLGSGTITVAGFLTDQDITAVDLHFKDGTPMVPAVRANVCSLPFMDCSFDAVTCVDVLEHVDPFIREVMVGEALRVARKHFCFAFPCGPAARTLDEQFRREHLQRNRPEPDWLTEHLRHDFPDDKVIRNYIERWSRKSGCEIELDPPVECEPISLSRLLRGVSLRAPRLYLLVALLLGAAAPLLERTVPGPRYRSLIAGRFRNREG